MLDRIVDLLEKTNNIKKSSYFWNAVSAFVLASQTPIILMIITKTNGIYDAGVFSIAVAVANLLMYIGQFGLRRYQSSDILEKFSFDEYHGVRIITCGGMILVSIFYCIQGLLMKDYSINKLLIIMMWCMIKAVQAYSDVFHGRMQQMGRLDVATKSSTIRYVFEMTSYIALLLQTHNLLISTVGCFVVSFIVMLLTSLNASRRFCKTIGPTFKIKRMKKILVEGTPLFFSMFLNMYVGNVSKYAIDSYLTDDIQALFNMIFMPAYVTQLVAHFIFNPILTTYAELWVVGTTEKLNKLIGLIKKQIVIVFGLSALALLLSVTIAIPILSWWFGTDLSEYKVELCVIMLGGGMLAYATYFSTVAAVLRIQKSIFVCYGIVSLIAMTISGKFVVAYGILGASILYTTLMTVLAVSLGGVMFRKLLDEKKQLEIGEIRI